MRWIKQVPLLSVFLVVAVVLIFSAVVRADDDEGDETIPFDDLKFFFEFNSSDNDLGVQLLLDGDAWDRLKISDPRGRKILDIKADGSLGRLGLTELFWESAEPSPEAVRSLIRAGKYEFEGETIEGDELEGEAELSHQLPSAPANLFPPDGSTVPPAGLKIRWTAGAGGDVPTTSYQVILEREDVGVELLVATFLDASTTELTVPDELVEPDTDYKYEVLAVADNGNKTITEAEFSTLP